MHIPLVRATPKDVMKLRMTGFENHRIFVIRLCRHRQPRRVGPAINTAAGLGIS